ncbi:MAG: alpha/beta fold hydrolase [Actinomycetota bacterium]
MKEFPVFVPSGKEHIGAVITVPDGDIKGLVVQAPGGGGAPRSHRFGLWTKLSRSLADQGLASVRMEWPGVGDSTGELFSGFHALPLEHMVAVAEFAMEATGTKRVGLVGNCLAARAAVWSAPKLPTTESIVLIFLNPLGGTAGNEEIVTKAKNFFQAFPKPVERAARAAYMTWRRGRVLAKAAKAKRPPLMANVRALDPSIDVLFLESQTELAGRLPKMVASLKGKGDPRRIEIDYLTGSSMQQFESRAEQEKVIAATTNWFAQSFGATTESVASEAAERIVRLEEAESSAAV